MSHRLADSETLPIDDGLPEGLKLRRMKAVNQKCKRKRARCIRRGIDAYFQHRNSRSGPDDAFDDFEDDNWYY